MPVVKELHYFSSLHSADHRSWATKTVTRAFKRELRSARRAHESGEPQAKPLVRHLKGLLSLEIFSEEWYGRCFERPDRAGKVIGEITPAYAELGDEGIQHLMSLLPGVRIIHILRHPIDRALSHIGMAAHRREVKPTENALLEMIQSNPQIFSRGEYQNQVPRWRRMIPPERLMIVPFGRVRDAPMDLLREVEGFIGVQPFHSYPAAEKVHATRPLKIPPAVLRHIEGLVQPTVEFIRTEFGEDFLMATR